MEGIYFNQNDYENEDQENPEFYSEELKKKYDSIQSTEEHELLADLLNKWYKILDSTAISMKDTIEKIKHQLYEIRNDISNNTNCPNIDESNTINVHSNTVLSSKEIISSLTMLTTKLRREYRILTVLLSSSSQAVITMKQYHRETLQKLVEMGAQLDSLSDSVIKEQFSEPIPKICSVIPYLSSKESFQEYLKQSYNPIQELVSRNDEDLEMSRTNDESIAYVSSLEKDDIEEFFLKWLEFDLACRTKDSSEVERIKALRISEEEKLKLIQKRENDFVSKFSPLEKEVSKIMSLMKGFGSSNPQMTALKFSPKAYSLSPPLFSLYANAFSYKAVTGDTGVDVRLLFHQTTFESPLFEVDPGRVQLIIDKGSTNIPPLIYPKTSALFPLNIRFSYLTRINLVAAFCQFPRLIGSEVTFLADLFCDQDDGIVSPNPIHHIVNSLSQLLLENAGEIDSLTDTSEPIQNIPFYIANQISKMQLGRPYYWAQILSGVKFSVDPSSISDFPKNFNHKIQDLTIDKFVQTSRRRCSIRAWVLYIVESLKENPTCIPPPGVVLPPNIVESANTISSMFQKFSTLSPSEFIQAGGDPNGVVASRDRDVHFLKALLSCKGFVFALYFALPLDSRSHEICIHLNSFPDSVSKNKYPLAISVLEILDHNNSINSTDKIKKIRNQLSEFEESILEKESSYIYNQQISQITAQSPEFKTIETIMNELILNLFPASQSAWNSINITEVNTSNDLATMQHLTHYSLASLKEIQQYITCKLPSVYLCNNNISYKHCMLVIQLVVIAQSLEKWVSKLSYDY